MILQILTENESAFLLWACGSFLSIVCCIALWIGSRTVKVLDRIQEDISEIKIYTAETAVKHQHIETKIAEHNKRILTIEKQLIINQ
jgi:septal ring factor EnvC (AmiA/AmiB activator)